MGKDAGRGAVLPESAGEYVSRTGEDGSPIPHACLKVPTGGGKTLLAAAAVSRLKRQRGLVIWITPSNAIYEQTERALRNREHPCRQRLDLGSGGRVKLLRKDDRFSRQDTEQYLCVMPLMLQSANRKTKDFLRIFKDSSVYSHTFFPDSDDSRGQKRLSEEHPDLDREGNGPVKHSLFNVIKLLRPVVILDEAHKAYGGKKDRAEEYARAISRLNPSMVIELSATPQRGVSNMLVDVSGLELKREEMIKLPVRIYHNPNTDWRELLSQVQLRMEGLNAEAVSLQGNKGRYIWPIALVRVQYTGKNQRGKGGIHSEDVREYLTNYMGVPDREVAVQSSELNELGNADLTSETSQVRWIITKDALKEGWDCSFAYVLALLDNTKAKTSTTQMVGRVMRQPHARRTGREALDQCYVYCLNSSVDCSVARVKNELNSEGLTGLGRELLPGQPDLVSVEVKRRREFYDQEIFLPKVLHREGGVWTELDYERHILSGIAWHEIQPPEITSRSAPSLWEQAAVDIGEAGALPAYHESQETSVDKTVRVSWFVGRLADVVPNSWQAARIVRELLARLRSEGQTSDEIHDRRGSLAERLRQHVLSEIDQRAEELFRRKLAQGEIKFHLESDGYNYRMDREYQISVDAKDPPLSTRPGQEAQLNLFKPTFARDFNTLETRFASYLDKGQAIEWWHRVAARQREGYFLQGWRKDRIWPDFLAVSKSAGGERRLLVYETKGKHLVGNDDSVYKEKVLELLKTAFNAGGVTVTDGPAKGDFWLVLEGEQFPVIP